MTQKGRILIVDDNEDVLLSMNMLLRPHVEAVRVLKQPERIDEFMRSFQPDVIILDMNFSKDAVSGEEGYQWLAHILRRDPQAVVLFITAFVDTEKAVRAIKAGAVDFIPKPWNKEKLVGIVVNAVELRESRRTPPPQPSPTGEGAIKSHSSKKSNSKTPSPVGEGRGGVMLGTCPSIELLRQQIAQVAPTEANVLITGENGTGKDVVAHLLHEQSRRSGRPFVAIDLGSIPEHLFESELFGYEKGAFTDAKTAKEGRIEMADGGTLFLDEIGNLTPMMQQKLLTVLEKHEFSRIGSTQTRRVDVRIVAATNADLPQRVADGTFRQDLLYRINTIELHLPPLRMRGDDIMLLAKHFAKTMAQRYGKGAVTFSPEARQRLLDHTWPGNVRELLHVIERAVVMSSGDTLTGESLCINHDTAAEPAKQQQETLNLAELERQAIMRAIALHNGNLTLAAEALGITRFALYRKIDKMEK